MGTLPIAIGFGADAAARRPLGLLIVGGLAFAQVVTLFITPGIFLYMQAFQEKFLDRFELSGYLQALLLVGIEQPRFDPALEVGAGTDGVGTYRDDTLMGSFVVGVVPGANLRYDFEL